MVSGSASESKEDIWGDEDWENDTYKVGLWIIDLDWKSTVWTVAGDGRITDVDEEILAKVASICCCEVGTTSDSKVDKDEGGCSTV